jgi:hypothetical protein
MTDEELVFLSIVAVVAASAGAMFGYVFSSRGRTGGESVLRATVLTDVLLVATLFALVLLGFWTAANGKHDLQTAVIVTMMYGTGIAFWATPPAVFCSWLGYRAGRAKYLRRTKDTRFD